MATETKEAPKQKESQKAPEEAKQVAAKGANSLKDFFIKFNNDWVMNFAAGLAFNLITAIFPIAIAIIAFAGLIFGSFDPSFQTTLIHSIESVFPQQLSSGHVLEPALKALNKNATFLVIIAVLTAIFGGSRLFISIEGYFAIIFHTRQRNIIPQNLMALGMLLLFVILVPLMVFAASIPAVVQSILRATPLNNFPGSGFFFPALGILVGLLITWVLFEAIYIIVPNQHISFRNSWRGAVVAAIALQIYLVAFPFYVTHFLGNDSGQIGFAVILLFFFYYFAVILLLGAEINAFFAEGVHITPDSVAAMVHQLTSHLQTNEKDQQEQATPTHKDKEPKEIHSKSEANATSTHEDQAQNTSTQSSTSSNQEYTQSDTFPEHEHIEPASSNQTNHAQKNKRKSTSQGTSTPFIVVQALVGTSLAFVLQFFRLKSKK